MWKFKKEYQDTQLSIPGKFDLNSETINDESVEWLLKKMPQYSHLFEDDGVKKDKSSDDTVVVTTKSAQIEKAGEKKSAKAKPVKEKVEPKANKEIEK